MANVCFASQALEAGMSLVNGIRADILNPAISLSTILRKAAVLAFELKNERMRAWVRKEQDGYSLRDADLPPYRIGKTNSYGNILTPFRRGTNVPIPAIYLPETLRDEMSLLKVTQGVRSFESHLETGGEAITLPWPSDLTLLVSAQRYDGGLHSAWRWLPKDMIAQVLDTVRNKLLDFILELQEEFPEIVRSDEALPAIPAEASGQVFHMTFYGPNARVSLRSTDQSTNLTSNSLMASSVGQELR